MPPSSPAVRRFACGCLVLLRWVTLGPGAFAAAAEADPRLSVGHAVEGELALDAARVSSPELDSLGTRKSPPRGNTYEVTVDASGLYCVSGRSHFFDTHLVLRNASGEVIAEDDDGGLRTHSRLTAELDAGRTYRVTIVTRCGEPGKYTLSLSQGHGVTRSDSEWERARFEDFELAFEARRAAFGETDGRTVDALQTWGIAQYHADDCGAGIATLLRALALREREDDSESAAVCEDLLTLAAVQYNCGLPDDAEPHVRRALEIATTGDLERSLLLRGWEQLAQVHLERNEASEARAAVERLVDLARLEGERSVWYGDALYFLGTVQFLGEEFASALESSQRALEIQEEQHGAHAQDLAPTLNQIAMIFDTMGEHESAVAPYRRAVAINQRHLGELDPETAAVLENLAGALCGCGRYEEALPPAERALAIQRTIFGPESVEVAQATATIAMIYHYQGKDDDADLHYQRAVALIEAAHGPGSPELASVLKNYAGAQHRRGDFEKALELTARGMEVRGLSPTDESVSTASFLSDFGTAHAGLGNYREAERFFRRAFEIMNTKVGPIHGDLAIIAGNRGKVAHRLGQLEEAATHYERAASIYAELPGQGYFGEFENNRDRIALYLDLGQLERARALALRAAQSVREHSSVRYALASEPEALVFASDHRRAVATLLSASRLAQGPAAERYAEVLRWKSRVARTYQQSKSRLFARMTPKEKQTIQRIRELQGQISTWVSAPARSEDPTGENIARARAELRRREASLERDPTSALATPDPTFEALQRSLPADAIWIDFVESRSYEPLERDENGDPTSSQEKQGRWGAPQLTAWIVPKAGPLVEVPLGPTRRVREAVAKLPVALGVTRGLTLPNATRPRSADRVLRELRVQLWDPLEPFVRSAGATTVFLCADGFLTALPFEVLQRDDRSYLIETHTFIYPRDAAAIVTTHSREAPTTNDAPSLLVVGGVDYAGVEALSKEPADRASTTGWAPLPGTAREASAVASLHADRFEGSRQLYLSQRDASELRLKTELPRHDIVHLATHGYFQSEAGDPSSVATEAAITGAREQLRLVTRARPSLRSGLVCAGANAPEPSNRDNGLLTADEVSWLDLRNCELVVLSACETALGRAQGGEGLMSLRRSFLQSGARSVISSLWKVDDASTEVLMREFYDRRWIRGESRIDALRGAQLSLLRQQRDRGEAPRPATWGAFVLTGEWR